MRGNCELGNAQSWSNLGHCTSFTSVELVACLYARTALPAPRAGPLTRRELAHWPIDSHEDTEAWQ